MLPRQVLNQLSSHHSGGSWEITVTGVWTLVLMTVLDALGAPPEGDFGVSEVAG